MFKNRFELCQDHKTAVYMILNANNEKIYIGQTHDTYIRSRQHDYFLRHGKHNKAIQKDYNSGHNFEFIILQEFDAETDKNALLSCERGYINAAIDSGFIVYNSDVETKCKIQYLEWEKERKRRRLFYMPPNPRKSEEQQEIQRYFDMFDGINPNETQRERELKEIDRYLYNT